MKRLLLLAAAGVALSACGAAESSSSSGGASTSSAVGSTGAVDVNVGTTSLGATLVDKSGHTLYYFTPEQGGKPNCTGVCASTWPLLTVSGSPSGGSGVTGQLSVVMTSDGKSEVTYNSWPLHTYSGDSKPGDVNGQGFGGKWFAATPSLTSNGGGAASPTPSGTYSPY